MKKNGGKRGAQDILQMRVTGGKFVGRKVRIPNGELEIRPLMDRMRESLFSIIGPLSGASFLDLFAGSGVAGIEAASRGAVHVDLVELDGAKKGVIEANLSIVCLAEPVGFGERGSVSGAPPKGCDVRLYIQDVFEFIEKTHNRYDLVYADPPFPMENKTRIATEVLKKGLLGEDGRFVIHVPADEREEWQSRFEMAGGLGGDISADGASRASSAARAMVLYDTRTYGRNSFLFYKCCRA